MIEIEAMPEYGNYPKTKNKSTKDFEESFLKFISYEKKSPFYTGFITKFGDKEFGEINNIWLDDFGKSIFTL